MAARESVGEIMGLPEMSERLMAAADVNAVAHRPDDVFFGTARCGVQRIAACETSRDGRGERTPRTVGMAHIKAWR